VALAEKTAQKVGVEIQELNQLLQNIETARPIDDLTVEDVVRAKPELLGKVQKMLERQQYGLPAYLDKYVFSTMLLMSIGLGKRALVSSRWENTKFPSCIF